MANTYLNSTVNGIPVYHNTNTVVVCNEKAFEAVRNDAVSNVPSGATVMIDTTLSDDDITVYSGIDGINDIRTIIDTIIKNTDKKKK